MTTKMTTEQMVRKCFCPTPKILCGACEVFPRCNIWKTYEYIAEQCRRFVRMEQKQKGEARLKSFFSNIAKPQRGKLPKHWGELKIKAKLTNQQLHDSILNDGYKNRHGLEVR